MQMRSLAPLGRRAAATGVAVLLTTVIAPAAAPPYAVRHRLDFEYRGDPPMKMPTTVAVGDDGHVYVADGVNDRILHFDATGNCVGEIRQVGDEPLAQPISVRVDAAGRLWIADTGHQRALVRASDGSLAQLIPLTSPPSGRTPHLTDAVPSPDRRSVWLVDNSNHRLVRADFDAGTQTVVGTRGEALGQFQHPFLLALGRESDLFVTDVINARVQVLTAGGRPAGSLGSYGVDLGQLYRPQGVACDGDGSVWVSDGSLGVVQIFSPTGTFRDVLRDPAGQPLKLDMPVGITLDRDGNLYVAELAADRVRSFTVTVNQQAPPAASSRAARRVGGTPAHSCAICHIEWSEAFAEGHGTPLIDVPPNPPDQPAVSRSATCLSCHDGSVVDSRRRVWQQHGHGTDITPPPNMKIPPNLPLVNGRVACRTCHSAHTTGAPMGGIGTAVFLRVPNAASELCQSCHPDQTRGPELGTHPTGGMPWPVPASLVAAGARVGPNPRELTCQVCHTPHGAAHDHLLVLGTETNSLCLTCHEQMRPGMFREGATEHPLSPKVTPAQSSAVSEMGTSLGPDERLICLSCHKLHHGKGQRYMLADDLTDGHFCLRCHEERRALLDSPHDLRRDHPDEKNRLGMTPENGGPCSSCHLFHRYARAPEANDLDPAGGKCLTCHQAGRVAQAKVLDGVNHPQARCTQCHNPHEPGSGKFLARPLAELCVTCHQTQAALAGGPHDRARSAASWPAAAEPWTDSCLPCHRPHGTAETGLFRAGLARDASAAEAACLPCHADAAFQARSRRALIHPRDATQLAVPHDLPLATSAGRQKQIACRTCHDPHRGGQVSGKLLRLTEGADAQQLCATCHTDTANIRMIGHAAASLRAAGFDATSCRPCHAVHADPRSVAARLLWPNELLPQTESAPAVADQYCVACHRTDGPVAPPAIATHPQVDMFNPGEPTAPGFLPLFNEHGDVDAKGSPRCRTCHLTHGRSDPAPLPGSLGTLNARELRARRWDIRAFAGNNVCTTCHGFDALRRFMYFHDPVRRRGPLDSTSAPASGYNRVPGSN